MEAVSRARDLRKNLVQKQPALKFRQNFLIPVMMETTYAALASLDLTSVFDVVNKKLLRKQLQVMGIPTKLIQLLDYGFVVGQLIVKLIKLTMKSLMLIKEPFKVFH